CEGRKGRRRCRFRRWHRNSGAVPEAGLRVPADPPLRVPTPAAPPAPTDPADGSFQAPSRWGACFPWDDPAPRRRDGSAVLGGEGLRGAGVGLAGGTLSDRRGVSAVQGSPTCLEQHVRLRGAGATRNLERPRRGISVGGGRRRR
ncbi:unnamed protein product, partial [Ectocarpus sp. 12 AP-2014]